MLITIHPDNPSEKQIEKVVQCLRSGGIVIYPTDTVYGMGCDITNQKAVEKICRIKGIKPEKAQFSFICYDLSDLSEYTKPIDTATFRLLKKALPGPFTFIFNASSKVPKMLHSKKKTVGIRVPDQNIAREIVKMLGNPILSTSLHDDDEMMEYSTDPELIEEKYESQVDMVIDGGYGETIPSTVVECTDDGFEILRQGKGKLEQFV